MSPKEEQGLEESNRDFEPRWHLITFGIVSGVVLIAYWIAKKLIFG